MNANYTTFYHRDTHGVSQFVSFRGTVNTPHWSEVLQIDRINRQDAIQDAEKQIETYKLQNIN